MGKKIRKEAKRISGLFFVIFSLTFILFFSVFKVSALNDSSSNNSTINKEAECFPEYKCGEWGECIEGLRSRTCEDMKCDRRKIVERKFCDELTCKPSIKCAEWSDCLYTDKTEDIFEGKIRFGGHRSRTCKDSTGCVDSFSEEGSCEEVFDLELRKVRECEKDYMVAVDPLSKKEIAKISLDSWKNKKLDLIFTQGRTNYCPSCYDGIKGGNESDIDCGGECKPCKKERTVPLNLFIFLFWSLSLIFSILIVKEIIYWKKESLALKEKRKSKVKKF